MWLKALSVRFGSILRPLAVGMLVLASCTAALAANTSAGSEKDAPVAAVYPPWLDSTSSFARAGAAAPVLGMGVSPFIVLSAARTPAQRAALRESGAWLILDGSLARWCGTVPGDSDDD
jgi:hypothetical protein